MIAHKTSFNLKMDLTQCKKAIHRKLQKVAQRYHQKCKRDPEKTSISALLTIIKPLTAWITINCGKF